MPGLTIRTVADASDPMSAIVTSSTTFSLPWWMTFKDTLYPARNRHEHWLVKRNGIPFVLRAFVRLVKSPPSL